MYHEKFSLLISIKLTFSIEDPRLIKGVREGGPMSHGDKIGTR